MDDLLKSVKDNLDKANGEVVELERSIAPIEKELNELQGKIRSMEHIEEISQQVQLLTKKYAWSAVYKIDQKIQEEIAKIKKLEERIPRCQARIDQQIVSESSFASTLISNYFTKYKQCALKLSMLTSLTETIQAPLFLAL